MATQRAEHLGAGRLESGTAATFAHRPALRGQPGVRTASHDPLACLHKAGAARLRHTGETTAMPLIRPSDATA